MWGLFFISVLLATLFLYAPGYFLLRAFRISRLVGLACAPFVVLVVFGLICAAYAKAGVFCSWINIVPPFLIASLVLLAIARLALRGRTGSIGMLPSGTGMLKGSTEAFDWACLVLYVCVGVAVTVYVFVRTLDGPSSFLQEFDNVHHLGSIRGFVESGDWSSFGVSLYPAGFEASVAPLQVSEFYPSAWHGVAALLVSALDVPVALAANATNFTFAGIVFPVSIFLLIRFFFPRISKAVVLGAFCTLAFSAYPWGFLTFGPLYSNLSSFAVLPAVVFCFVSIFSIEANFRSRITSTYLFAIGLLGLVFTQPNAVFTMGVFLIPFCVFQVSRLADSEKVPDASRRAVRIGLCVAFLVFVALLWIALYKAPFMQKVVTHAWPAFSSKSQAVVDTVLLAFNMPAPQILLGLAVALGIVFTLSRRQYLWMSLSFAMICVMYVVDVSSDGTAKFFLTGFWYTDSYRVAASAAFFAIPLACLGLAVASCALRSFLDWAAEKLQGGRPSALIAPCLVALAFLAMVYYPSYTVPGRYEVQTAFGVVCERLEAKNNTIAPNIYNANEREFVQKVKKTVPKGSLIINEPNDGTAFAYGVDGLSIYYRYLRTYGGEDETDASKTIRKRLNSVATDEQVKTAVRSTGAEYLIQLDQGDTEAREPYPFTYDPDDWRGIDAIDDNTDGFEVVLSDGDMRLYRITGAWSI